MTYRSDALRPLTGRRRVRTDWGVALLLPAGQCRHKVWQARHVTSCADVPGMAFAL